MSFEWSTFILECINFLVLVWLLTHFLYRPVMRVIEARRAESERIIADANARSTEAEALKQRYDDRLAAWEVERAAAQAVLAKELAEDRAGRLAALEQEFREERKRRMELENRLQAERMDVLERQAAAIASRFLARLMARVASPEVEAKLVDMTLADLAEAPAELAEHLRAVLSDASAQLVVQTAWPLETVRRDAFVQVLSRLAGIQLVLQFEEDAALQAGVRVVVGAWVLAANLRDELEAFRALPKAGE